VKESGVSVVNRCHGWSFSINNNNGCHVWNTSVDSRYNAGGFEFECRRRCYFHRRLLFSSSIATEVSEGGLVVVVVGTPVVAVVSISPVVSIRSQQPNR